MDRKATAAGYGEEGQAEVDRGPLVGFLTTRVMTTEREPLFAATNGNTPGQVIDKRIDDMRREFGQMRLERPDMRAPELHSITFEFPAD
jgi:hypothetical protein